nr:hypothetical protein [Salinisphaera sp.]
MRMHNPPHPGEVLKGLYFEPMGLSVTEGAAALGVSRSGFGDGQIQVAQPRRCPISVIGDI